MGCHGPGPAIAWRLRSLSNLALVINKLAASAREDGKSDFVPFRNSKLTHILHLGFSTVRSIPDSLRSKGRVQDAGSLQQSLEGGSVSTAVGSGPRHDNSDRNDTTSNPT